MNTSSEATSPPRSLKSSLFHRFMSTNSGRRSLLFISGMLIPVLILLLYLPFAFSSRPPNGGFNKQNAPLISQTTGTPISTAATPIVQQNTPTSTPTMQTPTPSVTSITPTIPTISTVPATNPTAASVPYSSYIRYEFESSYDGWTADYTDLSRCPTRPYRGAYSLCTQLNYASQSSRPFIYAGRPGAAPFPDLIAGRTIMSYVFVQNGTTATVKADWCIEDVTGVGDCPYVVEVPQNTWFKLIYTVPSNLKDINFIGMDFYSYPSNSNVTIFVDSISW